MRDQDCFTSMILINPFIRPIITGAPSPSILYRPRAIDINTTHAAWSSTKLQKWRSISWSVASSSFFSPPLVPIQFSSRKTRYGTRGARGDGLHWCQRPNLVLAQENTTVCNVSETPNHYCPKTPEQLAQELGEARRGHLSGTILGVIFAVGMAFTYFLSYHFVRYFECKERWHIERGRLRTIRKASREIVKKCLDNPYPENIDQ